MKTIEVSLQEIWMHTKTKIHKSIKKYNKKVKHKKKEDY